MGRRKIEIKAIKDDRNRSVTFLKRKGGLFKKAHELSVLCSVDVAVIIFGHNKKLYEFSSGDIAETLGRYQYWGPPHEHKGPSDFSGRGGDDDEEEVDEDMIAEEMGASTQNIIPPQLQNQPGYQHLNHAPSASPPIPNGIAFAPRHGTPQPQNSSRPSSRNHVRQMSTQYGGQGQAHVTPPPPANPNGYAYMANPSMYNPNSNPEMNGRPPQQGQYHHFAHPAHPVTSQAQSLQQQHQHAPHQPPHLNVPTHQHQPMHHSYMQDQGRHSLPPSMSTDTQQYQFRPTLALPDPTGAQQAGEVKVEGGSSPKTKSRSIFTPIDDQTSVFSRHLFGRAPLRESPQRDTSVKQEPKTTGPVSQTLPLPRGGPPPPPLNRAATEPQRSQSTPSLSDSQQPSRPKPRLKVQIPSDHSDSGSVTSSPRDSTGKTASTSAKKSSETGGATGVVQLPPPPPSPGTGGPILSAGAQGPPNPFARPAPPGSSAQNGGGYGGSSSSSSNQNMETPISALPSRFVSDALLPSPSSFFPEWGFGRTGPDTSMLPSPLPFTPAVQSGPGFARDEEAEKKRKNSDEGGPAEAAGKKLKT
ncbi:resistance to lethality of mkk1p386 overexpression [Talaromyces marneffei ATCC 18224]|uniref:SRF-type transcription factor RlmA n=2 Tax=Talaromyces marneffei TaxID=37727 RepID=B6QVP2_TALMQ|nr:SRF-type transcription factor RlmA [Talaromyces marneffei ATCC 18224]KAE8548742.1 hypothetical protein EYB25_009123 [Talaromyces marneffei]